MIKGWAGIVDVGLNDRREAASAGTGDEFVDDFAQIIGAEADILLELGVECADIFAIPGKQVFLHPL